jgi:hypothetical protein
MKSSASGVALPLETNPVTNPRVRASAKISAAHSAVMSGSLYELTISRASCRRPSSTSVSGVTSMAEVVAASSRSDCEVTQFWQ